MTLECNGVFPGPVQDGHLSFGRESMKEESKKTHEVSILGQNLRLKHEDGEYVRRLESYVSEKIEDAQNQQNIATLQLAARALLVLADECLTLQREKEEDQRAMNDRAQRMIEFIDKKAVFK